MDHYGIVEMALFSRCCRSGRRGGQKGERERRMGGPEEVVMDAHDKEDRTPDKKDGHSPI